MPKLSVIIPVYNAELYLNRCIDSVLKSTFTDFELLLIDDGSNDQSGELCDQYAENHPEVKVIHKENGGVSSARNLGIKTAIGEYITFIDSDDYIDDNFFEEAFQYIEGDRVTASFLMAGGVTETYVGEEIIKETKYTCPKFTKHYTLKDFFEHLYSEIPLHFMMQPWSKFYNADVIKNNHLLFDETISANEDGCFVLDYLNAFGSNDVLTVNIPFYHYKKANNQSLTNSFHKNHLQASLKFLLRLDAIVKKSCCSKEVVSMVNQLSAAEFIRIIHVFYMNQDKTTRSERLELIKKISDNEYIKSLPYSDMKKKNIK